MTDLPPGWAWTTLGEIAADGVDSSGPRSAQFTYIDITSIDPATKRVIDAKRLSKIEAPGRARQNVQCGDVLVSMTRPNRNAVAMVERPHDGAVASTAFCVLRPLQIEPAWLYYLVQTESFIAAMCSRVQGALYPAIRSADVMQYRTPLPPRSEQRRISAEIEKQFTRLDAATSLLAGVNQKLTKSIEGILSTVLLSRPKQSQTGDQAMSRRIRAERILRGGSRDPLSPDNSLGLTVPRGWELMSLDELTTRITSGSRDWSQYYGTGNGTFIMAQNVRRGRLDLSFKQPVNPPAEDSSVQRSAVRIGDLLITIVGANTGDTCAVLEELDQHYVCQSVALARPVLAQMSKYLMFWLLAPRAGVAYFNKCMYGQGRPHLGFDQIKRTPVLVPPADSMNAIVTRIEDQISLSEAAAVAVNKSLIPAARLRQAILKKAFEGKLVPQDPNDEAASVLLQRIRSVRAHAPPRGRRDRS